MKFVFNFMFKSCIHVDKEVALHSYRTLKKCLPNLSFAENMVVSSDPKVRRCTQRYDVAG